jgi:hypothetical protein
MLATDMRYTTRSRVGSPTPWFTVPFVVGLALFAGVPFKREAADTKTVTGAAVKIGNGTARAYITFEGDKPVEVGVAMSEQALQGLSPMKHGVDPHALMEMNVLPLPENNPTPFKFVDLGWNPGGHEPANVYDKPHFDFHFYTITVAERNAILPSDPQFEQKAARYPAAQYVPAGYFAPAPVAVPQMGVHWLDKKTPEINGQPFTTTFIYGSWDGELIFAEPMITHATIASKQSFRAAIGTAQQVQTGGYWPSSYTIHWDEQTKEYRVALTGLVSRTGL